MATTSDNTSEATESTQTDSLKTNQPVLGKMSDAAMRFHGIGDYLEKRKDDSSSFWSSSSSDSSGDVKKRSKSAKDKKKDEDDDADSPKEKKGVSMNELAEKLVFNEWRAWQLRQGRKDVPGDFFYLDALKDAAHMVFKMRYTFSDNDSRLTRWFGRTCLARYEHGRRCEQDFSGGGQARRPRARNVQFTTKQLEGDVAKDIGPDSEADQDDVVSVGCSPLKVMRVAAVICTFLLLLAIGGAVVLVLQGLRGCAADDSTTSPAAAAAATAAAATAARSSTTTTAAARISTTTAAGSSTTTTSAARSSTTTTAAARSSTTTTTAAARSSTTTTAAATTETPAEQRACENFVNVTVWSNCSDGCGADGYPKQADKLSFAGRNGTCMRALWKACYGPDACWPSRDDPNEPFAQLECGKVTLDFSQFPQGPAVSTCTNATYCHVFADGGGQQLYYGCFNEKQIKLTDGSAFGCGKSVPIDGCQLVAADTVRGDEKLVGQLCCCYGQRCNLNKTLAGQAINQTKSTCKAAEKRARTEDEVETLDDVAATVHNCSHGDICMDFASNASSFDYTHGRGCNFGSPQVYPIEHAHFECAKQMGTAERTCFTTKGKMSVCCCRGVNCTADNAFYHHFPDKALSTTTGKTVVGECPVHYALLDGLPGGAADQPVERGCVTAATRVPAAALTAACERVGVGRCFVMRDVDSNDVSVCCCDGNCSEQVVADFGANRKATTLAPSTVGQTTTVSEAPTTAASEAPTTAVSEAPTTAVSEATTASEAPTTTVSEAPMKATSEALTKGRTATDGAATTTSQEDERGCGRWLPLVAGGLLVAVALLLLMPLACCLYLLVELRYKKENERWKELLAKTQRKYPEHWEPSFVAAVADCTKEASAAEAAAGPRDAQIAVDDDDDVAARPPSAYVPVVLADQKPPTDPLAPHID